MNGARSDSLDSMNRSRALSLGGFAALAGGVAIAGLAVGGALDRRRLRDDPEYRELSRALDGGRERTVTSADGTRLHVEVFGDERAPTLVLLHGWTEAISVWHPQIVELSRDHRVVALDLRGHGESDPGEFSTDALADDLSAVLAACVPAGERAVLVGHSMGAMAIVAWAARHPEDLRLVGGAVLVATGMGDLVDEARILPLPRPLARARRLASASALTTAPVSPGWLAPVSRRAVRYITLGPRATAAQTAFCHDVVMGCPRSTWTGWGRVLTELDLTESVPALDVPTLVMAGGSDRLTPPDHARRLERSLPQPAGLVIIPGAGHMLPVEAADEVNGRVRAFTRDLLGAAATGS